MNDKLADEIERAAILLETFAENGMVDKFLTGKRTPNSFLCEEVAKSLRDNIAALRRSQPEPVPEGFVRTVPDPQMRTMCTAQAMGQQLAKLQEEGEMPTERMVEVAAQWLSESPLIQEPKLPPPAWMGLARHVLQAALSAAEPS